MDLFQARGSAPLYGSEKILVQEPVCEESREGMDSGLRLYSPWAQTVTTVWAQTVTTAWAQTVQRGLRLLQSEPTLYSGLSWYGTNMKKYGRCGTKYHILPTDHIYLVPE